MAVARMKKVTIVGHRSVMNEVVAALQELGCVQIVNLKEQLAAGDLEVLGSRGPSVAAGHQDSEERVSRIAHCISYLSRFENSRKGLIDSFMGQKIEVPAARFAEVVSGFDDRGFYETCVKDEQAATEARTERARIEGQIALLEPWAGLDMPVEEIGEGTGVCSVAASCGADDYVALEEVLKEQPVHLETVGEAGGVVRFVAFYLAGEPSVTSAFAQHGVTRVSFGDLTGTPQALLEQAQARLKQLDSLEAEIKGRAEELLKSKTDLLVLYDHCNGLKSRDQVKQRFAETGQAFALEGWVKTRHLKAVEDRLSGVSDAVEVMSTDPGPDDNVPVSLENHPLIAPFEVVTNIYGFPQYGEQDPTPLLAPFFFIYFGLALTDAAYGVLLALGFWYLMKKYRVPKDGRKFFHLMIYGGISTIIFGAMAGGWFGNLIDFMPESMGFLRQFRAAFFVLDPMLEPLKFMVISLALGVFQVWFGLLVKMVAVIKSGSLKDALYDQLPWLVLIPSLVMMAVTSAGMLPSLAGVFSKMSLISALGVVVTQGRNTKNIIAKPFVGLYALYGGVGYFSDVLSYTRLLALGLATGVIGTVINQIGDLATMIPVLGYVIMVITLVGGHLFNLVINVLGAFIHSGRLQFVEFFTKFFEGGGKGFTPFKKETKYVSIQ